jgi:CRISP-associated protein Cas1
MSELIVNTYGSKLRINNGLLTVTTDLSEQNISLKKISSIIVARGCSISSDVFYTAIENEIDILFGSKNGKPIGRIWPNKFGSIASIRKNQLGFSQSKDALNWVIGLLKKKIQNQISVQILLYKPSRKTDTEINNCVAYLEKYVDKLDTLSEGSLDDVAQTLRGWEGVCSRQYFECISKNIPEQYRFEKRSQHPAYDMFNALLNYGYGMLYGKIESALIRAGIDPYIGIFHRDEYNRPVLVYDIIELFRYWADIVVIRLCMQQIIFPEFFNVENGIWYLNTDGKKILIQSLNDYLDEVIESENLERTRATHINLYAQQLAQLFKQF